MDLNIVIGGKAGQGLNTLNYIFSKVFFKSGFNVHASKDYESRIRGGHNFMRIRISTDKVLAPRIEEDILLALNEETLEIHQGLVKDNGIVVFDGELSLEGREVLSIDASKIAKDLGNSRVSNTVFVGVVLKLLGLDLKISREVIGEYFRKSPEVKGLNLEALRKGYELLEKKIDLPEVEKREGQILINGNQAIGMGAVVGGVQFYSAYPMTPATGVMNYISKRQNELGIVVEQAEDEISAIMMALGGSYSGVRSMTGSSGGGFSLMVEAIGFSGIAEIPLVIAEVQRPGPATGLPTRTEQADLLFAVNASQGDFPLMVMSVRDAQDAFYQSFRAQNIAEKYQIPVIILSDQFIADSQINVTDFDLDSLENGNFYMGDEEAKGIKEYERYKMTTDGISPLTYPGQLEDEVVLVDSDEHNQKGNIIEDGETRVKMVDKRARKLDRLILEDLQEPKYLGSKDIEYLLIGWGSTYGPTLEAMKLLEKDGYKVGILSFNDVWPLPIEELEDRIEGVQTICIENNSTAQFSRLVTSETGIIFEHEILKYDGRPFTAREIYEEIKEEVMV